MIVTNPKYGRIKIFHDVWVGSDIIDRLKEFLAFEENKGLEIISYTYKHFNGLGDATLHYKLPSDAEISTEAILAEIMDKARTL